MPVQPIERWGIFELELQGPPAGNPFVDVTLQASFRQRNRVVEVDGFYDGESIYRIRFAPDSEGEWAFVTHSNVSELDHRTGSFLCTTPSADNHGPVRVAHTYHFAYADGTPYRPIGTTCYAWIHQENELEKQTLETLRQSPFNKLRMCVFPKHYTYNANEPELYPFEHAGTGLRDWDFSRFNPRFFQHLERRVSDLGQIGIEADIILFHPYDRWGFSTMSAPDNDRYLRYIVARLAAYRNVWWSLANEYDLMKHLEEADWDRFFQIIQTHDPTQHLRSIHNFAWLEAHDWHSFYDHGKPWVTHCSIQHAHVDLAHLWRNQYGKPVVLDEVCYEGDLPNGWGNITAAEMIRRCWEGTVRGAYVGHGETYLAPDDVIWWSKGGTLRGDSPVRIAFLRAILEEGPTDGLNPVGEFTNTHITGAGKTGEYYLTYFGVRQPSEIVLTLPEGQHYHIDIIDTWNMTIKTLTETATNGTSLRLPRKPYQAMRLYRT